MARQGNGRNVNLAGVTFVRNRCPGCGSPKIPVRTTRRDRQAPQYVTRRHICLDCGLMFKSVEDTGAN